MGEKKRHHTVPEVYLKNFAVPRKKQFYLFSYDKKQKKLYESTVSNLSVETDFYRADILKNPIAVEDYYCNYVESPFRNIITPIISRASLNVLRLDTPVITLKEKAWLSFQMIYQFERGRVARSYSEKISPEIIRKAERQVLANLSGQNLSDVKKRIKKITSDQNTIKFAILRASIDPIRIQGIAKYLFYRCWVLYRIDGDAEFITSDNPVMLACNSDATPYSYGLASETTVVYYPVSTRLMFALYSYDYCPGEYNTFDCCLVPLNAFEARHFINAINRMQLSQCKLQAYARSKNVLDDLTKCK